MAEFPRDPFDQAKLDDGSMSVLLKHAREGDRVSREKLLAHVQRYLAFVANQQLDKGLQARMGPSDVVQQSMMRAVENLDQFRGNSLDAFRAWIRKILVNEARQMMRDQRALKRDVGREQRLPDDGEVNAHGMGNAVLTPGTRAIHRERSQAVNEAMARLSEPDRQVIQWRTWEGLSFEEIGKRLGITASAASRRWYRALIQFRKQMAEYDE